MLTTPKGLRMHIGIFGRRNVGKSSILNAITNQETSIVSEVAGTTTDPVDKAMELLPLGPVLFIDTAGIDDDQALVGKLRAEKTFQVFNKCDLALVVCEPKTWTTFETGVVKELTQRNIPLILVFNKMDVWPGVSKEECLDAIPAEFRKLPALCMCAQTGDSSVQAKNASAQAGGPSVQEKDAGAQIGDASAQAGDTQREELYQSSIRALREAILEQAPAEFIEDPVIVGDIIPSGSTVILVVPIDKEAPKGRLILPQVQVIRDLLDTGNHAYVVQVPELESALNNLKEPPALVITDSQAFGEVSKIVPESIPLTGFSVLFSRFKGDLKAQAQGIKALANLKETSKVLIAEACTHHPIEEDIGTVKIPNLLRKKFGDALVIDHVRGNTFPNNLAEYDLVIHCGGCMFNRRRMLSRIHACVSEGVPITNYGLVLAYFNGVFERSIQVFPELN